MERTRKLYRASLRRTLILFILIAYAVIAVVSYFAFQEEAERLSLKYVTKFALSQNELERDRIRSLVNRDLVLAQKLADDPEVRAWMETEANTGLASAAFNQLESYRSFFHDKAYFVAIASSGSYWARTPATAAPEKTRLSPTNAADRWFYAAIGNNRDYSLNVDHNDMLGENRVWINVLVRDKSGKAIGLAGCGLDLTAFLDAIVSHEESGVMTAVVDSKGALMAYNDRSIIVHNAEAKSDAEKTDIYSLIDAAEDRESLRSSMHAADGDGKPMVVQLGFRGRHELCSISALPELGWYGLVFIQSDRVLGMGDFLPMGLVTLVSLLLVLGVVILAISLLVVKPIRKLNAAAGKIAAGAYDIILSETPRNEVGLLASSFNIMARTVKDYIENLEDQVAARTVELRDANESLEASRARIMDSISYARLIQDSTSPLKADLDSALSGHFEIVKQRDIVGGDFFFFRSLPDGFCAAVADCTGHGVPGAFMTMMAKAHLDRVVDSSGLLPPSRILAELDRLVLASLKSEASVVHLQNGLDIALCIYRASSATLEFAGGGLPLYVWKAGELLEIPGDPVHLGLSGLRREKRWTDHRIDVPGTLRLYLVSDGILDLPGGKDGFALGRSRLRALLESVSQLPFAQTGDTLLSELESYRGTFPQRDDLCLVGLELGEEGKEE